MAKPVAVRGENGPAKIAKRAPAEEAVEDLYASLEEEEEETEEEETPFLELPAVERPTGDTPRMVAQKPHRYMNWAAAKDHFITGVEKRGLYLSRGLAAGGQPVLAARVMAALVTEAKEIRIAVAALGPTFRPPKSPRSGGNRRSKTEVGAVVHIRPDVQKEWAGVYPTEVLAGPCRVTFRQGAVRKILLSDGQQIPIHCSRLVAERRTPPLQR